MVGYLIRALIAILAVAVTFWLGPPILRLIGLPWPSGDGLVVLKGIIGLLALAYIVWGHTPPGPTWTRE